MNDPDTTLDPRDAAHLIADWGFLVEPDLPDRPGPACLLVAIRQRPTLRHYDPEAVEYWISDAGRGVRAVLDIRTPMPLDTEFSWGQLRIIDRLRVTNEYVTFGGQLTADRVDGTSVGTFLSPAPLLRRGGHSQGWDLGAATLGAFFGRLRAAVGQERRLERLAAEAGPIVRYAAFVDDLVRRYHNSDAVRSAFPSTLRIFEGERARLIADHPAEWAEGCDLIAEAGLSET